MGKTAKLFSDIFKFNPYHDRLGRFTTANGASSFTFRPGHGARYDKAIQREKERTKQSRNEIKKLGKMSTYIMGQQGINTETRRCKKDLVNLYTQIELNGGIRFDKETQKIVVQKKEMERIKDISKEIIGRQVISEPAISDYYELRSRVKSTPIKISDYDKGNIADWNDYKKQSFGNMTISNKGLSIDVFYQELESEFPHFFDSGKQSTPSDQIEHINNVLNSIKPKSYKLSGQKLENAAKELTDQIIRGYIGVNLGMVDVDKLSA